MGSGHSSRPSAARAGALSLLLVAVLVASACGGDAQEEPLALPPELAESLAGRADTVAERLEAGDPCAAEAEADELLRESTAAVEGGDVPPALGDELVAGAQQLVARIECPAEAAEPPDAGEQPEEPEAPADEPVADAQTLVLGDAGEVEFRLVGDGLELVEVRPAPGWRHSVSADEDELDVDLERGDRKVALAVDAEGGGRLTLDLDYQAGRGTGAQTIALGQAGQVAFEVHRRELRLVDAALAAGWQVDVKQAEGDKIEVEAQHEDGSELSLVIELD